MINFYLDLENFNLAFIFRNGYFVVHCSFTTIYFRIRISSETDIVFSYDNPEFPTLTSNGAIELAPLHALFSLSFNWCKVFKQLYIYIIEMFSVINTFSSTFSI